LLCGPKQAQYYTRHHGAGDGATEVSIHLRGPASAQYLYPAMHGVAVVDAILALQSLPSGAPELIVDAHSGPLVLHIRASECRTYWCGRMAWRDYGDDPDNGVAGWGPHSDLAELLADIRYDAATAAEMMPRLLRGDDHHYALERLANWADLLLDLARREEA